MNELKNCPFCGSEEELKRKQFAEDFSEAVWIQCKNCGAITIFSMGLHRITPREKANYNCFKVIMDAWNRRMEDKE